jgi:hypothetical protein
MDCVSLHFRVGKTLPLLLLRGVSKEANTKINEFATTIPDNISLIIVNYTDYARKLVEEKKFEDFFIAASNQIAKELKEKEIKAIHIMAHSLGAGVAHHLCSMIVVTRALFNAPFFSDKAKKITVKCPLLTFQRDDPKFIMLGVHDLRRIFEDVAITSSAGNEHEWSTPDVQNWLRNI